MSLKPKNLPGRDPSTGQFVSGGGGAYGYRDHEVQHVRATARDNDAGGNSAYTIEDVVEIDPPGDRREEEAELVALNVHNVRAEIDEAENDSSSGNAIRAGWEISRDEDIGVLTQFRNEVDLSGNAIEGDPAGSPLSRQIVLDDMDPLWFTLLRGQISASGSPWNAALGPWYINYRALTGGGPKFSGGDSVHFHARQNSIGRTENWVSDISATLVWSVTDRD